MNRNSILNTFYNSVYERKKILIEFVGKSPGGNPAKIIGKINRKNEDRWNMGKKLYIDLAKRYLQNPMTPACE